MTFRGHMWKKKNLDFGILKYRQTYVQKDSEKCFGSVKELGKSLGNIFVAWILGEGIDKRDLYICIAVIEKRPYWNWQMAASQLD